MCHPTTRTTSKILICANVVTLWLSRSANEYKGHPAPALLASGKFLILRPPHWSPAKADDQSVTITGIVDTEAQHDVALRIAQSYAGERKVVDKIKVRGQA